MKRLFSISLILAVLFVAGRFWVQNRATAQGAGAGEEASPPCGDLNEDGSADLSDAVYLLSYLFRGGRKPVCTDSGDSIARIQELESQLAAAQAELATCNSDLATARAELATCKTDLEAAAAAEAQLAAQNQGLQTRLDNCLAGNCPAERGIPDTGQTTCYRLSGEVIDCTSDTCAGQDGFYQTGCPREGRFLDNGDGTVTDNCTGLMWQQDTGNDGNELTWCDALAYCENLEFAGHDDWRLPNVRELQSIADYSRMLPAIDPVFSPLFGAPRFHYWSSTTQAPDPRSPLPVGSAWNVRFDNGANGGAGWQVQFHVRAVRSGE